MKLETTDTHLLLRTMEAANECSRWIGGQAWESNVFGRHAIQKLTYAEARRRTGLTAQVVIGAIAKVADAYRSAFAQHRLRTMQVKRQNKKLALAKLGRPLKPLAPRTNSGKELRARNTIDRRRLFCLTLFMLSLRLPSELARRLGTVAAETDRTRTYVATRAIEEYVESEEVTLAKIRDGLAAADAGEAVSHAQALAHVERLKMVGRRDRKK